MKKRKKILIVDDHEINRKLLEMYLKTIDRGYYLLMAENGKEAVNIAKNKDIDLILMDIQMPVLNGIEATKQIKILKPDLPIIAISAYLDFDFAKDDLEYFDLKLTKPININTVERQVLPFLN